jgi:putative ABC transport system permease protein
LETTVESAIINPKSEYENPKSLLSHLRNILSEFILDLRAQKLRTFLTVFGIVWGTVAIVVLLAFGMGFKRQLSANMHGMGESVAIVFPGKTTRSFEGFGTGRPISLREEDAFLLASQVGEIAKISPEYSADGYPVRVGENPIYSEMRNVIPQMGGRFVDELDMSERRRVALIGDEVKKLLFGEGEAVGRSIYVGEVPFIVIGVMVKKTQPSSYNRRDQDRVFIPATTFSSVFGASHINNIIFTPKEARRSEEVVSQVRVVLGKRYKFDPADKDAVFIWDTADFDKFVVYFFLAFNVFMGLIGSFTLGVGGIGVANIMYIVVQ